MSYIRREHRNVPHWVYQIYDEQDVLVYVGCTMKDPFTRVLHLFGERSGIRNIAIGRLVAHPFPDGESAIKFEGQLIDDFKPRFNLKRSAVALREAAVS